MSRSLEAQLARLGSLRLDRLRAEWETRFGNNPPAARSKELLRLFLAWRLQEEAFGDLSSETRRRLRSLAAAHERNPGHSPSVTTGFKPGTILTRTWHGVLHKVQVLEDGFEYEGERCDSLSEIARRITGARWSGPAFFGLKRTKGNGNRRSTIKTGSNGSRA